MSLNIPVVLGSVRQGRKSEAVAKFLEGKLKELGHQTQVVDFRELPLPFLDCEKEPAEYQKKYPHQNVQKWSEIADAAEAFVFVIPEYNHGYTAVLKNAVDWLYHEYQYKPAGLVGVSSGKISGARAVEQFREVLGAYNVFDIKETLMVGPVKDAFDEQGNLLDPKYHKSADGMLSALLKVAEVMKQLRAK